MCCIQWNTDCEVCTNGDMEAEWFMICSESRVRPCVSALIRSELLASSAEWSWSPCHALVTSHQDTETQEKTDPEVKFVWRHNLAQPAVCCGIKLSQKVLIDPGDWVFVSWYRHEIGGLRNPHQSQQQQPSLVMKCSVPTGTIPGHLYWSAQ